MRAFKIIYEDNDMVVVDKSAGIYTIRPRHSTDDLVLFDILYKKYGELFLIHRLDRDTSGLIVFAKNSQSQNIISAQFQSGKINKSYYAFVDGNLEFEDTYLIDVPIMIVPGKYKGSINEKGKPSQTKIRVVENYRNFTMIEAKLLTGRTHQIRIHLNYIGYPLIIDKLYGHRKEFYLSEIKKKYKLKKNMEELPLVKRQTLHAHKLELEHPSADKKMSFNSELPKDLRALRKQLIKNG